MNSGILNCPRCPWCGTDPLYVAYHDTEWGVPSHDDRHLFEMFVLEGMQSGLSWITILRKRAAFRLAFKNFDPVRVARFGPDEITKLLQNERIIRNRAKIEASISNAQVALTVQEKYGSLDVFFWRFAEEGQFVNKWRDYKEAPAKTELSERISKECKNAGFKFFGPTVAYAFMQAVGMVNDHETTCFRYPEVNRIRK
jgi:DNA-3-methyladenine glycosylase I